VEQALAKKGIHMSEAGFVKTSAIQDPFKNQPYIDQVRPFFFFFITLKPRVERYKSL